MGTEVVDRPGPVLVIGATGQQGGATARALLERDWPVRAFVRDPDKPAAQALAAAGAQLAAGDLDDPDSVRAALRGVHGVFLMLTMMVGHRIDPDAVAAERRHGELVAELAADAGIDHLVYSSLNGAGAGSGIAYYDAKEHIEHHIRKVAVPATVLRPVSFMDNFRTYNRPQVDATGTLVVALAVHPEIPMPLIAVRDIGIFAALAFTNADTWLGRTVTLAGDVLPPPTIAEVFARVTGCPARHQLVPIEQLRAFDPQVGQMFEWFNAHPGTVDVAELRAAHPGLLDLQTWLRVTGWTPQPSDGGGHT